VNSFTCLLFKFIADDENSELQNKRAIFEQRVNELAEKGCERNDLVTDKRFDQVFS
jgi:hypothetical protein